MIDIDVSPASAVAHCATSAPSAPSLISDDETLSRHDVDQLTGGLAGVLAAGGAADGDRVAYVGRNSPNLLLALLASAHLGAVFVPINFRLSRDELRSILLHCGAHTVLVDPDFVQVCASIADVVPARRWLVADDGRTPTTGHPGWASARTAATAAQTPPRTSRTMDDLALIMYTSGTSGHPKGVMLTYGNLWWSAANIDQVFDTRRDDVHLGVAPMFHIGGINAFALRTLVRGGTILVRRAFDPERTLRDLRDGGVSTVFGVPMMFAAVARCPGFRTADLSGVRAAIIAGAPAPVPLIAEYAERGMLLQQSWGMTETAPGGTYLPAARTLDKAGSVGLPLPYTRIRLVDPVDQRDVVAPGVAGEILVRGPNVSPGYWNDGAATRMALVDGWLRTGDLATRDADGYLWIVGRRCEVINSGGEKIYPVEVERALDGMPDVSEVAVLGIPDPTWGETVLAVLECPDGSRPTLEQVREYGGRTIARYKLPTRIGSLPGLPRNQAGKVDKNRLRRQFGRAGST